MTMWLPSPDLLAGAPAQDQSVLIAQFWHELLSPSSPDTYRAKALDLPLLLEELVRIVSYAQKDPKWITHVTAICEELKTYIPLNSKVIHVHPVAEAAITNIARFKSDASDLPRLLEQARIFLEIQRDYLPDLAESARRYSADAGNKKLLAASLKGLATHVQMRGASEESIAKVADGVCLLPPANAVDALCGDVNLAERDYACYVAIAAPRAVASAVFTGDLFQECGRPRFEGSSTALDWYLGHQNGIVVEIGARSTSRQKAADTSLTKALNLIHLYALYVNGASLAAVPKVLVKDAGEFHVVEVTPSRHFGLEPRRNSEALARLRYTKLQGKMSGRLGNLLESHALAVSANDARSAVFHLWTALETLASGLSSEGIGHRVANVVAPIVAWRRIDKVVTYLAISMHELRLHTGDEFDLTHMPRSTEKHLDRIDLLLCLAGQENNPGLLSAFTSCAKSPLLKYRLYRAWEEFNDPRILKKTLDLSHDRIRWQTLRFYRARNLLVHHGEVDKLALRLLENAQYYLSTCVGRVLHDLTTHQDWDVNTSLEFHRQSFLSLGARLLQTPSDIEMTEVLVHAKPDVSKLKVWPRVA